MWFLFVLLWPWEFYLGFLFDPKCCFGVLLGVGAAGWDSECTGKGTDAQSGCQEAFGVGGMGAAKGNLSRGVLRSSRLADSIPCALLHCPSSSVRRIANASRVPPHTSNLVFNDCVSFLFGLTLGKGTV